jgi:phytoene dehydrogenase-like protein
MSRPEYDAVVVGAGPNGLAAAITLQHAGLSVLLAEGRDSVGGGLRTAELTLPGFRHDVCSAIHPLALGSPFFDMLPLDQYGLRYLVPPVAAAHPLSSREAVGLLFSVEETARQFPADQRAYAGLLRPIVDNWQLLRTDVLAPFHWPKHPLLMARFGWHALSAASQLVKRFQSPGARALWAGMAAHAIQPLSHAATSGVGLVLMTQGHLKGWPLPQEGAQAIADALASYFVSLGGVVQTGMPIRKIDQLPASPAVILDVTPKQLLEIAGDRFSSIYRRQLKHFRYGLGVFKIDWALSGAIPFTNEVCRTAGTVHLGGGYEDIAEGEWQTWNGRYPNQPFVLLAQPSVFDAMRAPAGQHTAWAYCHVPFGSKEDRTEAIERQVERFAPGFRDLILARHTFNTAELEAYNPNYVGGDINGGLMSLSQLFTRPALRTSPYRTSAKGIYLCSSSTPPGGGVHGLCGYYAARRALRDVFGSDATSLNMRSI